MANLLDALNKITDRQALVIEAQKAASIAIEQARSDASQAETVRPIQTVTQPQSEPVSIVVSE